MLLLTILSAQAYVLCGSPLLTAAIPAFTLEEVPAGVVFAGAQMRQTPCEAGGGTVSLAVADPATETELAAAEVTWEGSAGLVTATTTAALTPGTTYRLTVSPGEPHLFIASDEAVAVPDGAPVLDAIDARDSGQDTVSLSAALTPVDYAAGLSLVGLESSDGRLLALTDADAFDATDGDPGAGDGCYTPIQVFADGSTARGEAVCPEVAAAPLCATSGAGASVAGSFVALALVFRRRSRSGCAA